MSRTDSGDLAPQLCSPDFRFAEAAAVWMTLAACCGLHQVDFEAYLTDVLPRMVDHDPERLEELLPHNWKPLA